MSKIMRNIDKAVIGGFLLLGTGVAAAIDVDFSSAVTDIGTVAAAAVVVLVAIKAAQYVFNIIRKA